MCQRIYKITKDRERFSLAIIDHRGIGHMWGSIYRLGYGGTHVRTEAEALDVVLTRMAIHFPRMRAIVRLRDFDADEWKDLACVPGFEIGEDVRDLDGAPMTIIEFRDGMARVRVADGSTTWTHVNGIRKAA